MWVIVEGGLEKGRAAEVTSDEAVTVGSGAGCTIAVADAGVAALHASFRLVGESVELVPLESIEVPHNHALQIWTLWDRAVGPRSVGLVHQAHSVRLNLENLPNPGPNQLFEITLEPATGSPTGRHRTESASTYGDGKTASSGDHSPGHQYSTRTRPISALTMSPGCSLR